MTSNVFNIKDGSPYQDIDHESVAAAKNFSAIIKAMLKEGVDLSNAFMVIPGWEGGKRSILPGLLPADIRVIEKAITELAEEILRGTPSEIK